ncbi:hypothetical protein [Roseburia sp. 499]|uniref:hypothetical protein n=1 Tax=Roseburia sp. 499 TaxID=1261634 RepID=UPI000951DC19|nr:hypothetical protein [Roseburia sp. 499]WVK69387.1 hypothetical protein BIV20_13630 [Roseburia sp. 499]
MLIKNLQLELNNINFKKEVDFCLVTEVNPLLDYNANAENPPAIGHKYRCLGNSNSHFDVKIKDSKTPVITNDMIAAAENIGIKVLFKDMVIKAYAFIEKSSGNLKQGVTVTASSIELLKDNNNEIVM